jgi:phosphate transport system substrate-binding protein
MDTEILPYERHVMYRQKNEFPLEITVATGSYDLPDKTSALAVFVNRDNPISSLTLKQLDRIFGEQRTGAWDDRFTWHPEAARGPEENIRTWGQLGLRGEWRTKPIQVYAHPITIYSPAPGAMFFFRMKVLANGDKWNPDLLEFVNGDQMIEALGKDRYGIAYTGLCYTSRLVKALALVSADGAGDVAPTRENVASRRYPLTRSIYIYVTPEKPIEAKIREFLRYVVSRQGQQDVAEDGAYIPLTAQLAGEQLKKLQ